jgi:hypothetical protein
MSVRHAHAEGEEYGLRTQKALAASAAEYAVALRYDLGGVGY